MKSIKSLLFLLFFTFNFNTYSQSEGRFGVTAGYTNYVLDSNVLLTKSQPGYSIGILTTLEFNDNLEMLLEMNYTHHRMKFIGRETPESDPEEINFNLENINIPVILNYNFLKLKNKEIKVGVQAGITLSCIQNYMPSNSSKEDYVLDPIYLKTSYLQIDSGNETISLNTYIPMGLSTEYQNISCNLRYNMGLSDPLRNAPFYNNAYETKAKQNYFSVSFIYFFKSS